LTSVLPPGKSGAEHAPDLVTFTRLLKLPCELTFAEVT
jgi:hypothetical protein